MAMLKTLGTAVNLAAAAAQTAVAMTDTPNNAYRALLVRANYNGLTGTPTILIEGSEDAGTSYSTLATLTPVAATPNQEVEVKVYPLTRVRVSVAGSAGAGNFYVEGVQ